MGVQVVEYPFHPCHSRLQMEQGALLKEADVSSEAFCPKAQPGSYACHGAGSGPDYTTAA